MQKTGKKRTHVVPVLMRTLDILELLSGSDLALNSNEISNATDIPHTTTYRIVQTLLHRGYITQNARGRYSMWSRRPKDLISARIADVQGSSDLHVPNRDLTGDQTVEVLSTVIQSLRHRNEVSLDYKIY